MWHRWDCLKGEGTKPLNSEHEAPSCNFPQLHDWVQACSGLYILFCPLWCIEKLEEVTSRAASQNKPAKLPGYTEIIQKTAVCWHEFPWGGMGLRQPPFPPSNQLTTHLLQKKQVQLQLIVVILENILSRKKKSSRKEERKKENTGSVLQTCISPWKDCEWKIKNSRSSSDIEWVAG